MKIAYLVHSLNPKTGWGRFASDLVESVESEGHDIVVLKMVDDGLMGRVALRRGIGILGCIRKVRQLTEDCNIIHAVDVYPYGVIGFLARLGTPKKLIISLVGTYSVAPLYNWKTKALTRLALKSAHALVAISNFTRRKVLEVVSGLAISVITPGIRVDANNTERIMTDSPFILSVGAMKARKGYHVSIAAFAMVKRQISNLKYIIIGSQEDDMDYARDMKSLVKSSGLEGDVQMLSNITEEQLKRYYSSASLFILTSMNENHHFEGFGLVFLEAAAMGLPVIGTSDNGIEDAVHDGVNGILVPQGDVAVTASAILRILNDEPLREKLVSESYAWAKSHSSIEAARSYIEIYKHV